MPRIFLPEAAAAGKLTIRDEKARYLSAVLRCKTGDMLTITVTDGVSYRARILSVSKKGVEIEVLDQVVFNTESPFQITLLQGLLKGEKMDLVVQKTTELGIGTIIPVITSRSQVRDTKKTLRWRKIAEEASRQSGRTSITEIIDSVRFEALFTLHANRLKNGIIFWEEGGENLSDLLAGYSGAGRAALFTGPEGGFTAGEISIAAEHGFTVATLGPRVLRAETAAITAVSVVQFELGDLGKKSP